MKALKHLALALVAGASLTALAPAARAETTIQIGAEPICPYGFYDYYPYACAPSGFYGPEWFTGGVFIGAGPWYHGPAYFRGRVDVHYDGHYGYHGPYPRPGDRPNPEWHSQRMAQFHGTEVRSFGGREGGHEGGHEGGRR